MILTATQLDILAWARYEFVAQAQETALLPLFLGSTLRGSFGHALKAIACAMPHADCRRCLLAPRCRYPNLFETPAGPHHALLAQATDAPRPYLFAPPLVSDTASPDEWLGAGVQVAAGETIAFGLTLLGAATDDAPYFIYAVNLMAQHGLGAARGTFQLRRVSLLNNPRQPALVYTPAASFVQTHAATTLGAQVAARLASLPVTDSITLRVLTPLRLRVKKQLVATLNFPLLVKMLSLRLALVCATHSAAPLEYDYRALLSRAQAVKTVSSSLRTQLLKRRTNRQDTTLDLDGLLGEITFAGPGLPEFLPLLAAGELLNLGSGTAFGLGRYEIAS